MEVYIEQVLIDNLIINYLLLFWTANFLCLNFKRSKLFLSSLFGTLTAFVFPFLKLYLILTFTLKILIGMAMVLIAFKNKSVKQFFLNFIVFFSLTGVFGGFVLVIVLNLYKGASLNNGILIYEGFIPIGLFALVLSIFVKFVFDGFKTAKKRLIKNGFEFQVNVILNQNEIKVKGYLDSGNMLVDKQTQKPVNIISFSAFKKLLKISNEEFLLGKYKLKNPRFINGSTIFENSKILVFEVDNLIVNFNGKKTANQNALLGLSMKNLNNAFGCEMLLNSQILN